MCKNAEFLFGFKYQALTPMWLYPALFGTGLAAGFVDSIAGGGGLLTLPVLLSLGLPPQQALGTNKLQASFGSGSAMWHYGQAGLVDYRACKAGILFTCVGALMGTTLVQRLDPEFLKQFIPWLLVLLALYVLLRPKLGAENCRPRMSPKVFHFAFGLLIGFYDGFLGPGTGSFWAMAYMLGLGLDLTRATAHTKVMNFTSNLASLILFLVGNQVLFGAGLTMGLGQVLGARLGSRMAIKKGAPLIRPIFIAVVMAITFKLLYENFARQ